MRRNDQADRRGPAPPGTTGRLNTVLTIGLAALLASCSSDDPSPAPEPTPTDPELRVAFIGDQGLGEDSVAVLELIRDEATDFVIHAGDFDYADDPDGWDDQITAVLGDDYPYFASLGNHDIGRWDDREGQPGYRSKLEARLAKIDGASCNGPELGVASTCSYRGLFFLLSGVGTWGFLDHLAYIESAFVEDNSVWRVCDWHKNRHDFQVGGKDDEVALEAYVTCANQGAIIATGHEHSYGRSLTLADIGNPAAGYGATGEADQMEVGPGRTFLFHSGNAGQSLRVYGAEAHDDDTWWANIYAADHHLRDGEVSTTFNYTHGALFIDFHVDGDPRLARGYFKNIDGEVIDEFTITAAPR